MFLYNKRYLKIAVFAWLMFFYFFLFPGERCLAEYFEKYLNAMNNTGKLYRRHLAGKRYTMEPRPLA
jgi:hypothetical protein